MFLSLDEKTIHRKTLTDSLTKFKVFLFIVIKLCLTNWIESNIFDTKDVLYKKEIRRPSNAKQKCLSKRPSLRLALTAILQNCL